MEGEIIRDINGNWHQHTKDCSHCYPNNLVIATDKSNKYMEINNTKCEPMNIVLLSNPPQYKCKNCGKTWYEGVETPKCNINKQDLWLLEATANETESGCPRFIRFNRELINKI